MNNKIVLDCDCILLDYIPAFIEWVEEHKGFMVDPNSDRSSYNMSEWFYDMTPHDFVALIEEYNSYPRVIPAVEHAVEHVKQLKASGYSITVVTSFGGSTGSSQFRKDYLNLLFPDCFDEIIVLELGACKKDVLASIKPKYFVDDADHYLQAGLNLGITCISLTTSYNGYTDSIYVNNWNEINYIIGDIKGVA